MYAIATCTACFTKQIYSGIRLIIQYGMYFNPIFAHVQMTVDIEVQDKYVYGSVTTFTLFTSLLHIIWTQNSKPYTKPWQYPTKISLEWDMNIGLASLPDSPCSAIISISDFNLVSIPSLMVNFLCSVEDNTGWNTHHCINKFNPYSRTFCSNPYKQQLHRAVIYVALILRCSDVNKFSVAGMVPVLCWCIHELSTI